MVPQKYRADIDGLRGIAVLAVLVFHAFPRALPGGFVGVDVFFVISGFLITGLLLKAKPGGPALVDFYARRVRRLFPSLLVVVAGCLVFGNTVLLPVEFEPLGKHAMGAFGYVSNFVLWREAGYFDLAAHSKPLQHLWSLAVEEQFYVVWPLLLWIAVIATPTKRGVAFILLLVVAGSFAVNLHLVLEDPSGAFYLPTGRLWELGLGAAAAATQARFGAAAAAVTSVVGMLLICAAMVVTRWVAYPGVWALLPTVGTVCVIFAGPQAPLNRWLLARRELVAIGLISYPLYLTHWPLLVFARIIHGSEPTPGVRAGILIFSVGLSFLIWKFVEGPARRGGARSTWGLLGTSAAVVVAGFLVWNGTLRPRSGEAGADKIDLAMRDFAFPPASFTRREVPGQEFFGMEGTGSKVLFIGDSNMQQYAPRIELRASRGHAAPFVFATKGGCPPFMSVTKERCDVYFEAMRELAALPEFGTVVIAAEWVFYFEDEGFRVEGELFRADSATGAQMFQSFGAWLRDLRRTKRVVVISNIPTDERMDPKGSIRRGVFSGIRFESSPIPRSEVDDRLAPVMNRFRDQVRQAGAELIDPLDVLCDRDVCPVTTDDGTPIYKDKYHVRPFVVRERFEVLDALLDIH
jgi:peptidoglycan/LPS O-acetylase OafA/YrhL